MGFWIYMLVMNLLIPLTMIVFGRMFLKKAPRNINFVFGYRTEMSMKNRDTWEFAHRYFGRLWFRLGLVLLPVSAVPMLFCLGRNDDTIGTVGAIAELIQMVILFIPVFSTESALKRAFDRQGNRR